MKMTLGKATHEMAGSDKEELVAFLHPAGWKGEGTEAVLAVLTDDAGGTASEREAAHFALLQILRDLALVTRRGALPEQLAGAVESANGVVCTLARDRSEEGVLGVCLVVALVFGRTLYWCAVGDSRLYCLRNGELIQLTRDHTVARHLRLQVLKGEMSLADLAKAPDPDALTSYLGMDPLPEIDANLKPFTLTGGDRLLLCSQGVHSALSDERIAATMVFDAQTAVEELVSLAGSRAKGRRDVIHAAVICLPAPKRPAKGQDGWSPAVKDTAPSTAIAQMPADRSLMPVFSHPSTRIGLAVAALAVTAILFVVVSLFLLLKEPAKPQASQQAPVPAAVSMRVERPEDRGRPDGFSAVIQEPEPPIAAPVLKPKLQYRDMEPNHP